MKECLLIPLFFLFVSSQAIAQNPAEKPFVVHGVIDTVPNASYYVSYRLADSIFRDTIELDSKSHFIMRGKISEPMSISLLVDNTYDEDILGDYLCYWFWVDPGAEVYFHGLSGFGNQVARNASTQQLYETLKLKQQPLDLQRRLLRNKIRSGNHSSEDERVYYLVSSELEKMDLQFIEQHPEEYYAASLLNSYVVGDPAFYSQGERLYAALSKEIKMTKLGKYMRSILDGQRSVQLGGQLSDFTIKDVGGNDVSFSTYRGNYLLIEFWASWCGPCRRENPNLRKTYETYQPMGFEILAVSLDDERASWIKAIEEDQLPWVHVSELKGLRGSPIAKKLLVRSVPDNFLLDRNGTIIGRNLRGEQLDKKLAELR